MGGQGSSRASGRPNKRAKHTRQKAPGRPGYVLICVKKINIPRKILAEMITQRLAAMRRSHLLTEATGPGGVVVLKGADLARTPRASYRLPVLPCRPMRSPPRFVVLAAAFAAAMLVHYRDARA